ncbi:MAG: response regulator [Planctomycetota bacterium]|jgi:DNA-binding response OmpR family regulator|nr:response regulator [Planctomycetota bacterium]
MSHRILVVEDMPALREHFAETMAELGDDVVVDEAGDGVEALEKVEAAGERGYDLVLTDITMPRMDGESLLHELRARNFSGAVIVLTAHGQDELIIRCLRAGACDYLIKPVTIDELQVAATTALQHMPSLDTEIDVDYDAGGWFEVSGKSDYAVLYRYRRFLTLLDSFQLTEPAASEVRLTLEELGRNAIEWGNRGDGDKMVRFSCRILPYKVIVQIADEGEGFNPHELPDPSSDPFAHIENRRESGKRMGGYGVHLIKNIMDKVTWNAKGNVVVAIKYLKPTGGDSGPYVTPG